MSPPTPLPLGLIEGYFGRPWTWDDRRANAVFLGRLGYGFYIYAPKADPWLRRQWREPHPPPVAAEITRFAAACRRAGLRFGLGLSPYAVWSEWGVEARAALQAKLMHLDELGVEDLALLFDDMPGDAPALAATQLRVIDFVAARTRAGRLWVCPTYYSNDATLDRVFGRRPRDYLTDLGRSLPPSVGVFWTGEEVCSREYAPAHLDRVAETLRRRPVLWDNYPANDGPRMSRHLHLRAPVGRGPAVQQRVLAHAVNPALQPTLTRVVATAQALAWRLGDHYCYGEATDRALEQVLGRRLGRQVRADLLLLQDAGLAAIDTTQRQALLQRYQAEAHPGAREIVAWLLGAYRPKKLDLLT